MVRAFALSSEEGLQGAASALMVAVSAIFDFWACACAARLVAHALTMTCMPALDTTSVGGHRYHRGSGKALAQSILAVESNMKSARAGHLGKGTEAEARVRINYKLPGLTSATSETLC